MYFEGWELALIDEAGYNGISEDHIHRVADAIRAERPACVTPTVFANACMRCNIDPNNFTDQDYHAVMEMLK